MNAVATQPAAAELLTRQFLVEYPDRAASAIEAARLTEVRPVLARLDAHLLAPMFEHLAADVAAALVRELPEDMRDRLLDELASQTAVAIVAQLSDEERAALLASLANGTRRRIEAMLDYPAHTAGRMMDTRIPVIRRSATVGDAAERLSASGFRPLGNLFVVDGRGRLAGRVLVSDLAVSKADVPLDRLLRKVRQAIPVTASREQVAEMLDQVRLPELPVIDHDGRLIGLVHYEELVSALQDAATADIQTMVGVSREEKALSAPLFVVRKRLPWLMINLVTAFLAAAVVGVFEDTIARYTALAVLLPVVAGQSGNTGAQALAVVIRGLALREIAVANWLGVMVKEAMVGMANGAAIAVTCAVAVYLWSDSAGLALIILLSMVISMVLAGVAGALVPIALTRAGQDPAQSSSIVLTTVTDVAGFFSFLGIATVLAFMI